MKSIENTFELKRNAVIASPSSIFSKVDVITMLEELQAVVLNLLEEVKIRKDTDMAMINSISYTGDVRKVPASPQRPVTYQQLSHLNDLAHLPTSHLVC
jgi:hypothetical protein